MWQDRSRISAAWMIALVLAPQVIALAPRAPFNHLLLPRQTGSTPCTSTCAVFDNAITTCTTTACVCNANVANSLQSCVNCAVSVSPTSDVISSANDLVSTYESTCNGISLPTITVPSGSSTGTAGNSGGSTSISVAVPTTSKTVASATTNVVVTPSTTTTSTQVVLSTTNTAVVVTSPTIITTTSNPIVQVTIHPSTATLPAIGPTTSFVGVSSGAIGNSVCAFVVVGLHVVVGCLLGTYLAV